MILKQSTPYTRMFLMVSNVDHITGLTGAAASMVVNLSKNGGIFGGNAGGAGAITEVAYGWYKVALQMGDTATGGDLAYHITATGADSTDFVDQVQAQVFTDLAIVGGSGSQRALISDNLQQGVGLNGFTFLMVNSTTGIPQAGLVVTAQRSLGGGGFATCANSASIVDLGTGIYSINLAGSDLNAATVMLRFTASGASDLDILLIPTP